MSSRNLQADAVTRVVGALVILVLVLAFLSLFIASNATDLYFAWTIRPATTAIMIGEGYMAGALFFVHVVRGKKWKTVQAGFLPITCFTIAMLGATLLHWDRFHQGTFIFILWFVIYVITPFLVPYLWWRNRSKNDPDLEANDLVFSPVLRRILTGIGAVGILLAIAVFIWPGIYITLTPWKLSELTARIFSGWTLLSFATMLSLALDGRWSSTRLLLQSVLLGQGLTLISLPRIWADLNPAHPMTYVFVGALTLSFLSLLVLYFWAERISRSQGIISR